MRQSVVRVFGAAALAGGLIFAGSSAVLGQMRPGMQSQQPPQQPGMQQNNMQQPGQMNPQNTAEANFVANVRRNSKVETDLSKMALKNSGNDQVKQFAQQVIAENRRNDMALTSATSNAGASEVSFPAAVPIQTHKAEKQMKKLTGPDFDKLYIGQMDGYIKNDQQLTTQAPPDVASGNMGSMTMQLRNAADQRAKQLAQVAQSENLRLR
ncbi:MAG: DUF4142 domain-containing protein [Acidobacteriaceae bacterium]